MHGVRRVRQSKEATEAKKKREQARINDYLLLTDDVLTRKKNRDWSRDAFDLTTRLLQINPEFYTIWNYRRNIMLNGIFPASSPEGVNNLLATELSMTTTTLKAHPKVYWVWNHRRWCLENVPDGPGEEGADIHGWKKANWDRELFVVEKMLDADPRNFHAWNYRRYVLASMPVPRTETSELEYTTRKIEANFSNFSAWHQRSKVYASLWDSGQLDAEKCREEEFELVRNAMYTDPEDQSVWMYHRWLIGPGDDREVLEREVGVIKELLDEQPDSKWCMESLVHYQGMLLQRHSPHSESLVRECLELLEQLKSIDPARKNRYEEIATRFKS